MTEVLRHRGRTVYAPDGLTEKVLTLAAVLVYHGCWHVLFTDEERRALMEYDGAEAA